MRIPSAKIAEAASPTLPNNGLRPGGGCSTSGLGPDAAHTVLAGTGRFGRGLAGVRDAARPLDQWADKWRPVHLELTNTARSRERERPWEAAQRRRQVGYDVRAIVRILTARGVRIEFVKEQLTFAGEDSPTANLPPRPPSGTPCLTRLVRAGNDIVLVAELAGHSRLETTRRYSLPDADRQTAMDALTADY